MSRSATVHKETKETTVDISLDLDGTGVSSVSTGVGFFDHMLETLSKHSLIDLTVKTSGDLGVDAHHSVEDVALAIGTAIDQALGDRVGIARFGEATVPLDEALANCVIDLSGRSGAWCFGEPEGMAWVRIGAAPVPYAGSMTAHVAASLAANARLTLHLRLLAGRDPHHIVEAQYKALARALRAAIALDPRITGLPSTKGAL